MFRDTPDSTPIDQTVNYFCTFFVQIVSKVCTKQKAKFFPCKGLRCPKLVLNLSDMSTTHVPIEELRLLADEIQQLADAYAGIADRAESAELLEFPAAGIATARTQIDRLLANVGNNERKLQRLLTEAARRSVQKKTARRKPATKKTKNPRRKAE